MIFGKVLLAVNQAGTADSPLLKETFELVKDTGSRLMIFHSVPEKTAADLEDRIATFAELGPSESVTQRNQLMNRELQRVKAWLEELCRAAKDAGIEEVVSSADVGIPGPAIVEIAEQWGANLIVLGRRRHSTLSELFGRGAGNYVHRHANCSILFIHEGEAEKS